MNQFVSKLWRILLESAWIFWLGGMTFYIAIVVPVGGEILGAATQGEVTQSVTWYMNLAGLLAISVWGVEHWRRDAWAGVWTSVVLFVLQWWLIYLRHVLVAAQPPWPWEGWSFTPCTEFICGSPLSSG